MQPKVYIEKIKSNIKFVDFWRLLQYHKGRWQELSGKETIYMSLGTNIQFYRKKKNMTQEGLAEFMSVSRQTVSKWESDIAFPETDKLITLSDYFGCTIDSLIKGDAEKSNTENDTGTDNEASGFTEDTAEGAEVNVPAEDTSGYDKEMNSFTKSICLGTSTVLAGVAVLLITAGSGLDEALSTALFLLFAAVGAAIFIVSGIRHGNFVKENPNITPFYTDEEKKAFKRKFPFFIAGGAVAVLLGVIILIVMNSFSYAVSPAIMPAQSYDELCAAVFIICVAIAAPMFIYGGMQYSKYEIEEYNNENAPEKPLADRLLSAINGGIMLTATIVLFIMGFCFDNWELCWIGYPIGAVLIGIISSIFNAVKK